LKTSSSYKQSGSSWTIIFQGLDKFEGVGQLSQGMGAKDHSHSRSKRPKESCLGWPTWHS